MFCTPTVNGFGRFPHVRWRPKPCADATTAAPCCAWSAIVETVSHRSSIGEPAAIPLPSGTAGPCWPRRRICARRLPRTSVWRKPRDAAHAPGRDVARDADVTLLCEALPFLREVLRPGLKRSELARFTGGRSGRIPAPRVFLVASDGGASSSDMCRPGRPACPLRRLCRFHIQVIKNPHCPMILELADRHSLSGQYRPMKPSNVSTLSSRKPRAFKMLLLSTRHRNARTLRPANLGNAGEPHRFHKCLSSPMSHRAVRAAGGRAFHAAEVRLNAWAVS